MNTLVEQVASIVDGDRQPMAFTVAAQIRECVLGDDSEESTFWWLSGALRMAHALGHLSQECAVRCHAELERQCRCLAQDVDNRNAAQVRQ